MPRTFLVRRVGSPFDNLDGVSDVNKNCEILESTLTAAAAPCNTDDLNKRPLDEEEVVDVVEAASVKASNISDSLTQEIRRSIIINEETGEIKHKDSETLETNLKGKAPESSECPSKGGDTCNSEFVESESNALSQAKPKEVNHDVDVGSENSETVVKNQNNKKPEVAKSVKTTLITPYQTLPSFASLAYNMVLTNQSVKSNQTDEAVSAKHSLPKVTVRTTCSSSLVQRKLPIQSPSFKVWNDVKPSSIVHPNTPNPSPVRADVETQSKVTSPSESNTNAKKSLLPVINDLVNDEKEATVPMVQPMGDRRDKGDDPTECDRPLFFDNKDNLNAHSKEEVEKSVSDLEEPSKLPQRFELNPDKSNGKNVQDRTTVLNEKLKHTTENPEKQENQNTPKSSISTNLTIAEKKPKLEIQDANQENKKPKIWNPLFHVYKLKQTTVPKPSYRLPLTAMCSDNIKQEVGSSTSDNAIGSIPDNRPVSYRHGTPIGTLTSSEKSQAKSGGLKYTIDSLLSPEVNPSNHRKPVIGTPFPFIPPLHYNSTSDKENRAMSPAFSHTLSPALYLPSRDLSSMNTKFEVKRKSSQTQTHLPAKRLKLDEQNRFSEVNNLQNCYAIDSTPKSMKNILSSGTCPPLRPNIGLISTPSDKRQPPNTPMLLSPGMMSPLMKVNYSNVQYQTPTKDSAPYTSPLILGTPIQNPVTPVQQPKRDALTPLPVKRTTGNANFAVYDENSPREVQKSSCKNVQANHNVELVNGGFGIKNPSFRPPRPSDITNIHQDSENGKGSYSCKICNKEFSLQRLLNRHLKCHSAVKRYLCTFCGKGFNDTFDLKRHTRIHTGVKPYKCSHCDRSFTQRCSLESHCRKVHNVEFTYGYKQRRNKIYVCEECGNSTDDPEEHFAHLKRNHPNNPALTKSHDKRQFKFGSEQNTRNILRPRT